MTFDDILAKAPERFQTGYLQEQCAIYNVPTPASFVKEMKRRGYIKTKGFWHLPSEPGRRAEPDSIKPKGKR